MQKNIIVIEDKPSQLRLVESTLGYKFFYHAITFDHGEQITGKILSALPSPDAVLIDLSVMGQPYLKVIRDIKAEKPHWPIIALMQYGHEEPAMQAIVAGASDYITKPLNLDRLSLTLQNILKLQNMSRAIARLERVNIGRVSFADIIGRSPAIRRAISQAGVISSSEMPIWIEGEQGTGKELFARAIHGSAFMAGEPFVLVECSKLTEATVEVFALGQAKIVDATHYFMRKIHEANCGTLYLKDINVLSQRLQQVLLELLETGMLPLMDEFVSIPLNIKIIIGCNKTIEEMIAENAFTPLRKKLYGMVISLPALRDRKEDIVALAKHFVAMHAASENKIISDITEDAVKLLENNPWPGNIVQLSRTLQRAVLMCNQNQLDAGTLRLIQQLEPVNYSSQTQDVMALAPTLVDIRGHIKKLKSIEEEVIRFALVHSGGSMTRTARNLGIGRSTLYRKIGAMLPESYISRENQTTRPMMDMSAAERS